MFSSTGLDSTQQRRLRQDVKLGRIVRVQRGYFESADTWSTLFPYDRLRLRSIAKGDALKSGALTGVSAATVRGFPIRPPSEAKLEIVGPSNPKQQRGDIRMLRWARGEELETSQLDVEGFKVSTTSPRFCLAQLARSTSVEEAVVAMDHCLHAGILSLNTLRKTVEDYKWHPKVDQVALAVSLTQSLTESPMETRLRLAMLRAGLSGFLVQPEIYLFNVGRIIRPDFLFPHHMLIVEYDGRSKYQAKQSAAFDDMVRMHDATNSGLSFLRVNKRTLESGEWLRDLKLWLHRAPVQQHPDVEIRGGRKVVNKWVGQ